MLLTGARRTAKRRDEKLELVGMTLRLIRSEFSEALLHQQCCQFFFLNVFVREPPERSVSDCVYISSFKRW